MSWLTNFVRPKIRALVGTQKDMPDHLWLKCPGCGAMLFQRELAATLFCCKNCNHHLRLDPIQRLETLFDDGRYETFPNPKIPLDPLKFKDQKRYTDRLKDAQQKTGRAEAIVIGKGLINGESAIVAAFDFTFMGGSMSVGVGEALVRAAELAVEHKCALITVPASGGARMQEGILSLMQMPRSIIAVEQVKNAGLPYIVLLTDPTTGGVTASFAMVGDIHISEPGAQIGFAGARVIENTIRETLPEGFQRAEYLLDHGMVDLVVPRAELPNVIGRLLRLLKPQQPRSKNKGVPQLEKRRA